jgi:xanthine phosphoribosyltransferase
MKALVERIRAEAVYLDGGIVKVDGFINHQIDPLLTTEMGKEFARHFRAAGATKIVTAEVSGIAPSLAAAQALGLPLVYARKHRPITMPDGFYMAEAPSHTKGGTVHLMISPEYLRAGDRALLIDDFLATGCTIEALVRIVAQSGAILCGIGCVIEKAYEHGRERLAHLGVPIVALARIDIEDGKIQVS